MVTKVPAAMADAELARVSDVSAMISAQVATEVAAAVAGLGTPSVPAGIMMPFAGTAAPSGWLLCYGQAVSRTTYATLFAAISTQFGIGDGSTTFNVPDMRGRVPAGKDDMGGTAAGVLNVVMNGTTTNGSATITGLSSTANLAVGMTVSGSTIPSGRTIASIVSSTSVTLNSGTSVTAGTGSLRFGVVDGATLGAKGGAAVHTLSTDQMPAHSHDYTALSGGSDGGSFGVGDNGTYSATAVTTVGGGRAHPIVQPTMVTNYLIKT